MIKYDGDSIVLTGDTSGDFIRKALKKDNKLNCKPTFPDITIRESDNGFTVEIPGLELPSVQETEHNRKP